MSIFTSPFESSSVWNTPVAAYNPTYTPTVAFSPVHFPALSPWPASTWVGMHQATGTDPQVNLYYNANAYTNVANSTWARSGNNSTIESAIRAGCDQLWAGYQANMYSSINPSASVAPASYHHRTDVYWSLTPYAPSGALPASDNDGHMAILQPNGWMLETYATIIMSNGDIVCLFASYTDPTNIGAGDENGRRSSMVPNYAGLVRDGEITSGHITHALSCAIGPDALSDSSIKYPAIAFDAGAGSLYSGILPMGTLLAIPQSVNLSTLGIATTQVATLIKAAQEYGIYVVDTDGTSGFIINTDTAISDWPAYTGPLESDLNILVSNLQVVSGGANYAN